MKERTLIIIKPDAVNRTIIGDIIHRFELKGFKIIGMKMTHLTPKLLKEHYAHHATKSFYPRLEKFMSQCPTVLMVLEGNGVVEAVRVMCGPTHGLKALPGTIRGDYSLSMQNNIVHTSDDVEAAKQEIARFFKPEELFDYNRIDTEMLYSEEER